MDATTMMGRPAPGAAAMVVLQLRVGDCDVGAGPRVDGARVDTGSAGGQVLDVGGRGRRRGR